MSCYEMDTSRWRPVNQRQPQPFEDWMQDTRDTMATLGTDIEYDDIMHDVYHSIKDTELPAHPLTGLFLSGYEPQPAAVMFLRYAGLELDPIGRARLGITGDYVPPKYAATEDYSYLSEPPSTPSGRGWARQPDPDPVQRALQRERDEMYAFATR